jgi:DNA repair protein RadD
LKLRPYQSEAIEALYAYFAEKDGNPIVDTPTGSGKSVILAGFIARALADYPATRIIVLTHVKELIEQDAAAILRFWPQAPVGIWSAGLKRREVAQVTVAGIASVHQRAGQFSPCDIVIIDECHLLSRNAGTMYRRFLYALKEYNPKLKVIGLSATPYRLDSGLLTHGDDAIFTDFAYSANVGDLIDQGYLSTLISKRGLTRANLSGLHRRAGDFIPAELAARMDKVELITGAVEEMIGYGQNRKSWLVFCSGVEHAQHVADCLNHYGIEAAMVCGDTPAIERARLLAEFKAGRLRALTNADVLTTGFDHPGVDLIAMLRPTDSVGLYVQILGRGLRPVYAPGHDLETRAGRRAAIAEGPKPNCLVLDFAGNVETHGPIDSIHINHKSKGKGDEVSIAPAKECPTCHSLLHTSVMTCPECGYEWPVLLKHGREAGSGALLASQVEPTVYNVTGARYTRHAKPGKPPTLRVEYRTGLLTFFEFIPLEDSRSWVRKHAVKWFWRRGLPCPETVEEALAMTIPRPTTITVLPDGKYFKVVEATFDFA